MSNFTLTITAAPELLAAISNLSNSMNSLKVTAIPQVNSNFPASTSNQEHITASLAYNQAPYQTITYSPQETIGQQTMPNQQPAPNQTPANLSPAYNQPASAQPNITHTPLQIPPTQVSAVPTSTPVYTMEQIAVAATQLMDSGRRTELVGLLQSFGVQALTSLPKEQYGAFATRLRALGAKI